MNKWQKIEKVFKDKGIKFERTEENALVEFWTDTANQDIPTEFEYDGTPEDFVRQFKERAEAYNVDDEVELYANMRGKNGVPNTIRELLDDCQEAKDTLTELSNSLQIALRKKRGWIRVEEANPIENGFYLVTSDGECCGEDEPFTTIGEFENGRWKDDTDDYKCIIAWMPMPKPLRR